MRKLKTDGEAAACSFWPTAVRARVATSSSPEAEAWGGRLPKVETLGQLLSKKLPPKTPRIAPWLHAGESCLLWGGTGTGKSMVAMTLALAVAGGGKVFGWDCPNPCRVLLVDGEQSERDLQARFQTLGATIEGWSETKAHQNLFLLARTAQPAGSSFFDLSGEGQASAVVDTLKAQGIGLVVFDNLSTLSDGLENENDAGEFKPVQSLLAQLKGANIACILVHHSGKDGLKFRGSSNLATTFERIFGLLHDEHADPRRLCVRVKLEKFRDKAPDGFMPEFPLELKERPADAGGGLYWEVGDFFQLREGWRMFRDEGFRTKPEFVQAFNTRFGTTYNPSNFSSQFAHQWTLKLGVKSYELKAAQDRMNDRRKETAAPEPSEDGAEF